MLRYNKNMISFGDLFFKKAEAHVLYIADDQAVSAYSGLEPDILSEPLRDPTNIFLIIGTLIIIAMLVLVVSHSAKIKKFLNNIEKKAFSYKNLVAWMMRLSLGIGFIGSGISGWLISPVLHEFYAFSLIQIIIGFFLLSGFLTTIASVCAIVLYFVALGFNSYMLGSLDVLAMSLSMIILDPRKPGLDDILSIPAVTFDKLKSLVPKILRFGIGGSLVYLSVFEKFFNPALSRYVVDITGLTEVINVSSEMWVLSAGAIEFILGVLLILGYKTRLVSAITFFVLSMSFFYFGEDVTSHITLFGILSVIFVLGNTKKL